MGSHESATEKENADKNWMPRWRAPNSSVKPLHAIKPRDSRVIEGPRPEENRTAESSAR